MASLTLPVTLSPALSRIEMRAGNSFAFSFSCSSRTQNLQIVSQMKKDGKGRRVWRRRKLTKKDDMLDYKMERVPFLEEQVRKIQEGGKLLTMDIERLMLSEDNRFDFVNEIAAEANEYVESNRDEYGGSKKAILHVLSNRVNDSGFYRPEAYAESDPFKPGPSYLKEEFT
ncbi:protein PLASTID TRANSCRIPTIONALLY ACTIVE 7 isoform X1 [Ziziphus jujuba]|uniref:Protein PLASTID TRANSCRIPTIONALLY ACTIVE 7 isoform X1 n=1 Tax=Ziziphus jujuba TaxID=326968 RepID=A0A6P4A0E9_ZIZJJ|nr:protein PLASTID TRANSCRIPTIONALLY ACTIVE 7 isoform X1 [Ziziphus jujuba]